MVTVVKSPKNVYTTSTSRGKNWSSLANFVSGDNDVARCDNITTKTGANNKPQLVTLHNFNCNLPSNATILKLKIIWKDRFVSYGTDVDVAKFPSFGATTFSFANTLDANSVTGTAPSINFSEKTITLDRPNVTAEELNSTDFGLNIQYAYNQSNDNTGGIYVAYVRLEIEYDIPKYNVSITEPRHHGTSRSWSTEDDPTILQIGQECTTQVKIRSLNGYDGGTQTVRINFPINYRWLDVTPETGELIVYEDRTYVDWVVNPPLDKFGEMCTVVNCTIKFTPRAYVGTEMVSATILSTGQLANYYVSVAKSNNSNYSDDIFFVLPQLQRKTPRSDSKQFVIQYSVENISRESLEASNWSYPSLLRLYSYELDDYVPFYLDHTLVFSSNSNIDPYIAPNSDNTSYSIDFEVSNYGTYNGIVATGLSLYFYGFTGNEGEYEFRLFIPHQRNLEDKETWDMYTQNLYIEHEPYAIGYCSAEKWIINTPNAVSSDGTGYAFQCKTANGFQFKTRMEGSRSILEQRVRHIGGLRLAKSHYEPKLKFSNKVNEGIYKNRAYYNKTGQWDHDLSLNIYLPKYDWRTLQEFVKMDKPVAIDTCPSCNDDDVLNHRGWVEIEDISNVERVNGWWYKGDIGVKRITDKYFGKANIIKGSRVSSAQVPYTLINTVEEGQYYLNYFDLIGGGQLIYDKDNDIINQIIVPTGEEIHMRSKWANKDIDDYRFIWHSVQPSEPTDESNDYKNNSIVYTILDNLTMETLLTYTLYDFTTFDEVGNIVNTCKVSCTTFDKLGNPTLLFNKQIRLDYSENDIMTYGSTTRFEFNANTLAITESGLNGQELMERDIILPNGEYILDICFANNDVGLLEPDFISYMDMDLKENVLANSYSSFYSDILVSSFVLPNMRLLFYRYSEDGVIYYYTGETNASYIVDGFQQYKGGVDLQTATGASILYVNNYTQTLYLSNGLCKIGFDRIFGTVSFYVYDATHREYVYVNMLKIDDWSEFNILSITDDKAVIQFGETIWSMWRGHPFIQCEHIGTDLVINDDYNTIFGEAIVTSDGDIVYDGSKGKKETYLYDVITDPELVLSGTHAPSFISGDTVILRCYLKNRFGEYIVDNDEIDLENVGKINFIINDKSTKIDPTPSTDNNGRLYWEYIFIPPRVNDDYQAYAQFIPVGEFTESKSNTVAYTVRKIDTKLYLNANTTVNLSDESYRGAVHLEDVKGNVLANMPVKVYEETLGLIDTVYTDEHGDAEYTFEFETDGEFIFKGVFEGTDLYNSIESLPFRLIVKDTSKTDVTLIDETYITQNNTIMFRFTGVNTGYLSLYVKELDETYTIDMRTKTKEVTISKTGTYNYTATYEGTSSYNKARLTGDITVEKYDFDLTYTFDPSNVSAINLGETVNIITTDSTSNIPIITGDETFVLYDNGSPVLTKKLSEAPVFLNYKPSYSGEHQFKVVFRGNQWINNFESNSLNITVNNSTTQLIHSNGDIYRHEKDYVRLLDANDNPLANKLVKYTINGVTYNKTTDSNGYINMNINLNEGQYPVHILFAGDNAYVENTLDYNLTVKGFETIWKPSRTQSSRYNKKTAPYQIWNNLGFDGLDGSGYCTCGYSTNISTVIGTKAGTWNTPDQLALYNYGFNIPSNAKIKEIRVRVYERQYDPRSNSYPNIGNAVVSIQDHEPRTCSNPPLKAKSGFNINEVVWNNPNITPSALNSSNFTVFLNHSKNMAGDTGCLMLKYFEVGVSYTVETSKE